MSELVRVVVDAMGGDYAPEEPVKGAVEALRENQSIFIYLAGKEDVIRRELKKYTYPEDRLKIVPASQVIETGEPPAAAIQKKKDSSLVAGLQMVRKGEADAFVSSGSTGAVLVGGQVIVRKIPGVERAPLAPLIPTERGVSLLIDCGANVDARPSHLLQFAAMGSIYMEYILGVKKPRVAIVNIGAEEEKGNALVKETFPLLKECRDIHFVGNIEARDIPKGKADVIVTEAFVGNVILKLYEGVASVKGNAVHAPQQDRRFAGEAGPEGDAEKLRRQRVRRRSAAGTAGTGGENPRKRQGHRDPPLYSSVRTVPETGTESEDPAVSAPVGPVTAAGGSAMELEKLQKIIASVLNVDVHEITPETTFAEDLGADSLDGFQILMGIEEEFDITISNEEAAAIVSVKDAVEKIKKAIS